MKQAVLTNWGNSMQLRVCMLIAALTICLPPVWAFSQKERLIEKKISLELNNEDLTGALHKIEEKINAHFMYDALELKRTDKRVSGVYRNETVAAVLGKILSGTGLGYEQLKEKIIIHRTQTGSQWTGNITGAGDEDVVVRGHVTDENGDPLPGVNIKSKNSGRGTVTDADGNYIIVLGSAKTALIFSFVGYASREMPVEKTQVLNMKMEPDSKMLNEVVVTTPLGIKREQKALGYAATVITGEQLTNAPSANWMDALSGKVPGLNLIRSNGGPTGSIKIILRGENNLTGNNEALVVVDNVVVNQGSGRRTAVEGESAYGTSSDNMPADYGSGLNDINPEDIADVSILSGPAAAALYGERGANGAVIITTKSGKSTKKKGLGVTLNSNVSVEQPNRWPDLQYEYGQGLDGADYYSFGASADGANTASTSSAYGPRFEGQQFFQYDPATQAVGTQRTPWVPYKNKLCNFFNTGQTYANTISIDGSSGKTSARFSFTNVHNKWIIPNTGYNRNTISMSVNSKVSDKLQISSKINYTNKWSDNLPGNGYGNQSIMYWYIFWQPNADPDWLKDYWAKGQEGRVIKYPFSTFPENPYAIANEFINRSNRHSLTGNVQALYNFTSELSLQLRASMDFGYEQRAQERPYDAGAKYPKGSYRTQNIFSMEASSDFLLRYNKKVSHNLEITATAGGSILRNNYNRDETRADSLTYPGIYTMSNAAGPLVTMPWKSKYGINSFYGLLSISYKEYIFVDITGRQDWNSTLATPARTDNAGFFYPSVSTSWIISDITRLPSYINFAKLRFSVASVGSGTTIAYQTAYNYPSAGSLYNGGLENPSTLANPNLKPLRTITYEAGTNVKMFNSRFGFDVSIYTGNTRDQILSRTVDRASGYQYSVINAGKVNNKGLEVALNGNPVKSKNFEWNIDFVASTNKNTIRELADSSVVLKTGPVGGGQLVAMVGGSMGDLYGRGYQRSPDGQVIYDSRTGFALLTQDVKYLGNTIPKWKLGFGNDFRYKQFHLNLRFDAQFGAIAHSLMHYKLAEQGKLTKTLPGRYSGIIGNGVVQDGDGKYRPNDVIATDIDEYYRSHYGVDNAEGSTFSTDFLKFREARLDYTLPPQMTKRLGLQRVSVGVYGRDLFIWSPWPIFDPEFGTLYGTDIVRGFEIGQFPSTRTFGANLVVGF